MRRFALNIAQERLSAGLRLDPLGQLTAPQPLAGLRGKGGEGKGREGDERKRAREGREKEGRGKGREGKGRKWEGKGRKRRTLTILSDFLGIPVVHVHM